MHLQRLNRFRFKNLLSDISHGLWRCLGQVYGVQFSWTKWDLLGFIQFSSPSVFLQVYFSKCIYVGDNDSPQWNESDSVQLKKSVIWLKFWIDLIFRPLQILVEILDICRPILWILFYSINSPTLMLVSGVGASRHYFEFEDSKRSTFSREKDFLYLYNGKEKDLY